MARDVLLDYTDYNEQIKIHTDARSLQLGAVIIHNGEPIYFYSRKLTSDQMRHTVKEKELVSIVETLK